MHGERNEKSRISHMVEKQFVRAEQGFEKKVAIAYGRDRNIITSNGLTSG